MSLELTGKLICFGESTSGQGTNGQWSKLDFVLETADQYPKKVCFSAWNDKAVAVSNIEVGSVVKAHFDIESREYNQKWYTQLKIWKFEVVGAPITSKATQNGANTFVEDDKDDLPF